MKEVVVNYNMTVWIVGAKLVVAPEEYLVFGVGYLGVSIHRNMLKIWYK